MKHFQHCGADADADGPSAAGLGDVKAVYVLLMSTA
jgi:hypothetical protein